MISEARALLADVGGTNVRFALSDSSGAPTAITIHQTADYPHFEAAAAAYLAQFGHPILSAVVVCAAGPLADGRIHMTNCPWVIDPQAIAAATGCPRVQLVNDFAAMAAALPHLPDGSCHPIGGGTIDASAPRVVIGPGTGLGVAALVPAGEGRSVVVPSEGGNISLAPETPREIAIIERLTRVGAPLRVEQLLSGSGLPNLYAALAALEGEEATPLTAAEIAARAAGKGDPLALETLQIFAGWLGAFAGDMALVFTARGGVYLGGGILPKWGALFDERVFRTRFEGKGVFRDYLTGIPVLRIEREDTALFGLAALAREASAR
ncbi:MAG: glucokinase [Alphaproteobacteria bacterium]|nr:glucokinase [Alphaproteobacteria bacterium]